MLNSDILHLYNKVLEYTSLINNVREKDIKQAIKQMHKIYIGSPESLSENTNRLINFNEVAYRCAYLFKYASFHTYLAYMAMNKALTENPIEIKTALNSLSKPFKLCTFGCGPGTDVIGVLAAMHDTFGFFPSCVKVIDMYEWESTFSSVINELRFGQNYGSLSESVNEKWFNWSFLRANFQRKMSSELKEILSTADLVTMIKFVSAVASKETSNMIEKIFKMMKPGAFVLFVDNAVGGFEELINNVANKYKLNAVSTPVKYQHYRNEILKNFKYGYRSCFKSTVAAELLMKSDATTSSYVDHLIENTSQKNFTLLPTPVEQKIHLPQFKNFRHGRKSVNLVEELEKTKTFEPVLPTNRQGRNFSLQSDPSPMQDILHSFYKPCESIPSRSSSSHSLGSQNMPDTDKMELYNPRFPNESFKPKLSLNVNSSEVNLPRYNIFPLASPTSMKLMHATNSKNFKTYPKSIRTNEYDTVYSRPQSNFPASGYSPLSEFLKKLVTMKKETERSSHKSFESGLSWTLPLNSSLHNSSIQNDPIASVNQTNDSANGGNVFEDKLYWDTPLINKHISQSVNTTSKSRLNITSTNDSNFSEESLENNNLLYSPVNNSSPMLFRELPSQGRYSKYDSKGSDSPYKTETFWDASTKSLAQQSTVTSHDENSLLSSVPNRTNSHLLNQSTCTPLEELGYSACNQNPTGFDLPLNQTLSNDYHPFRTLLHQEKYQDSEKPRLSKYQRRDSALKPFDLFSLQPPYRCPEKHKASKRECIVSVEQHKLKRSKRSQTYQSKNDPSLQHQYPEKPKVSKRRIVSSKQNKLKESKSYLAKQAKQNSLLLQPSDLEKYRALKRRHYVSLRKREQNAAKRSYTKPLPARDWTFNVTVTSTQRKIYAVKRK